MPRFLEVDYYTESNSAKTTLITNALLPIPTHFVNEKEESRWKIPSKMQVHDLMRSHYLQVYPDNVKKIYVKEMAQFLLHEIPSAMESFESDYLEEDEVEVIPSSFPESDTSSQFHLDPRLIMDSGQFVKDTEDSAARMTTIEMYSRIPVNDGFSVTDVPIMGDPFSEALTKMLVHKVLLKRLQMIPVQDPLLRSNNTPWLEGDFFENTQKIQAFSLPTISNALQEEYGPLFVKEVFTEEFLAPKMKIINNQLYMKNCINFDILKETMNCSKKNWGIDPMPAVDIGPLQMEDEGIEFLGSIDISAFLSENINSVFDLKKEDACELKYHDDSHVLERARSPVFGLPDVNIKHRVDEARNYYSQVSLRIKLEPFVGGLSLKAGDLMPKKEYRNLKLELWELEKHFDQERLLEPILPKTELPNPIEKAKCIFTMTAEQNHPPYTKEKIDRKLYQQINCSEDPSVVISTMCTDFELSIPPIGDNFIKLIMLQKVDFSKRGETDIHAASTFPCISEINNDEVVVVMAPNKNQLTFDDVDNPLESFMHFRKQRVDIKSVQDVAVAPKDAKMLEMSEEERTGKNNTNGVTSNTKKVVASSKDASFVSKSKIVNVPFTGQFEDVVKCLVDRANLYLEKVKENSLIPYHQSFCATSVDNLRFLLKETVMERQNSQGSKACQSSADKSNLIQGLKILLVFRQALHLLFHSCLESTARHISSFIQPNKGNISGLFESLQEKLLHYLFEFQQRKILHPKFEILLTKYLITDRQNSKILVVIQQGLNSLASALEKLLSERTSLEVYIMKSLEELDPANLQSSSLVIVFDSFMSKTSLEPFDLVIQFDASTPPVVKELCEEIDKHYVGLISDCDSILRHNLLDKQAMKLISPLSVIGSVEMMQHRHLIYILESRHNILFIERNYSSLQLPSLFYYPDIIFSLEVSLVLLPLLEIRTQSWDMETFTIRLIALGFQSQHCFILVHGIGAPSKYLLDKITLQNLFRLRASLSNLSQSSASFITRYKIIIAVSEEDIALNVRSIAEYSMSLSATVDGSERQWLRADLLQDEAFLLQIVCLNSFSAQLLLSKFNLEKILTNNPKQIKDKVPDFPDHVLKYFRSLIMKLKSDQLSSSTNSSPVSAKSISQKSASSSVSNRSSETQNVSSSPLQIAPLSKPSSTASLLSNNVMDKGAVTTHPNLDKDRINNGFPVHYILNTSCDRINAHAVYQSNKETKPQDWKFNDNRPPDLFFVNKNYTHSEVTEPILNEEKDQSTLQNRKRFHDHHLKEHGSLQKKIVKRDVEMEKGFQSKDHRNASYFSANLITDDSEYIRNPQGKGFTNYACRNDYENEFNNLLPTSATERVHYIQQVKNHSNIPGVVERTEFFIGKSQPSPQPIIKSELDDENDSVIFLGKSQGSPPFPMSHFSDSINITSDPVISNVVEANVWGLNDERNSLIDCFPSVPVSAQNYFPSLTSKSKLSLHPMDRLQSPPSQSRRSTSQNSTPSSNVSFGIFSAKACRRVMPMSNSKATSLTNDDSTIHNSLDLNTKITKNIIAESLIRKKDCENSHHPFSDKKSLLSKESDKMNLCFWNRIDPVPDPTQLPFSVSKDLKKHLGYTNSNVLGKGYQDGVVYGERISRTPFALRDKPETQIKNLGQGLQLQKLLPHEKSTVAQFTCSNSYQGFNNRNEQGQFSSMFCQNLMAEEDKRSVRTKPHHQLSDMTREYATCNKDQCRPLQYEVEPKTQDQLHPRLNFNEQWETVSVSNQIHNFNFSNEGIYQKQSRAFDPLSDTRKQGDGINRFDICDEILNRNNLTILNTKDFVKEGRNSNQPTNIHHNSTNQIVKSCDGFRRFLSEETNVENEGYTAGYKAMKPRCIGRTQEEIYTHKAAAIPPNSSISHCQDGEQTSSLSIPASNIRRVYNLPYTPRCNISVGLAQPLQRSNPGSQENLSNDAIPRMLQNNQHYSTNFDVNNCHPPTQLLPQSTQRSILPASPPMDLVDAMDSFWNQDRNADVFATQSDKMKKWNNHLQRLVTQEYQFSDSRDQQHSPRTDYRQRQKRLCLKRGDGNNGQMKLAFK